MSGNSYITKHCINKTSLWDRNKLPLLGRLDMELTERCNNNCIHCYINLSADDLTIKNKELSSKEIKDILKEAVSLGCLSVRFTGGEPLLREDFEELYIFTRKLGLRVAILTNATLINTHLAKLFSHIPPLERIEITVYGMEKKTYESVTRVNCSFEAMQRGIKLLLEKKVPFVVRGALLLNNKKEINEFEKWTKTLPWMDNIPLYSIFFDLHGRRDKVKNLLIKSLRISPKEGLKILTRRKARYIKEMKRFCSKFIRPHGASLFSCGSGKRTGCVDAYGYFQPCVLLRHPDCVYDLKKGSIKDALTKFFPRMRKLEAKNPDYLKRCARCFLKGLCEQCPAKSWEEHGTLDTPVEYLCDIAHVQAKFLGLLGEDEMAWEVKDWKSKIKRLCI